MGSSGGNRYKWLIELLAYWQGQINSQDLCLAYGISVTQSKKYLVEYNEIHPQNLKYNRSAKAHLAQELFTFNYINGDVAEYLDWLNSQVNLADVPKSNSITHAELRLPPRAISPQIMRGLVNAVKQKRRIDVEYLSLSKTTAEGRVIQPHTFVKTGLRWHLRGYCEYRGDFRDFVLSRFRGYLKSWAQRHTFANKIRVGILLLNYGFNLIHVSHQSKRQSLNKITKCKMVN